MSYFGYQGIHSRNTRYRHEDGSVTTERPASIIAYHDECALLAFDVDTSTDGWGAWHHDLGMSWSPGDYSSNGHPCSHCGQPC